MAIITAQNCSCWIKSTSFPSSSPSRTRRTTSKWGISWCIWLSFLRRTEPWLMSLDQLCCSTSHRYSGLCKLYCESFHWSSITLLRCSPFRLVCSMATKNKRFASSLKIIYRLTDYYNYKNRKIERNGRLCRFQIGIYTFTQSSFLLKHPYVASGSLCTIGTILQLY